MQGFFKRYFFLGPALEVVAMFCLRLPWLPWLRGNAQKRLPTVFAPVCGSVRFTPASCHATQVLVPF